MINSCNKDQFGIMLRLSGQDSLIKVIRVYILLSNHMARIWWTMQHAV